MADLYLARFRADPSRVRVAVRHHVDTWVLTVSGAGQVVRARVRDGQPKDITAALHRLLRRADSAGIPGIDRHMSRAYNHPMEAIAPADRVSVITEADWLA